MRGVASSSFAVPPKGGKTWREIGANVFLPEKSLEGEEETLLSPTFFLFPAFFFWDSDECIPSSFFPFLSFPEGGREEGRKSYRSRFLFPPPPSSSSQHHSLSLGLSGVENELNQVLPPPTSPHSTKAQFTRDNFFAVCKKAAF